MISRFTHSQSNSGIIAFAFASLSLCIFALIFPFGVQSQTLAPGGPGKDAHWSTAGKQAIGTSASLESKVWFTIAQGVMTEVYYPNVTVANVEMLQFVVVNPKTKRVETERDDTVQEIQNFPMRRNEKVFDLPSVTTVVKVPLSEFYRGVAFPGSLLFRQVNRSKTGGWSIAKTYLTDPASNSVLISVSFSSSDPDDDLYVYYDPSLRNTGMHDTGWFEGRSFLSEDGEVASALTCGRCSITDATSGFLGINDGLTQLRKNGKIVQPFSRAENGNLVQVGKITPVSLTGKSVPMLFALGFGKSGSAAVAVAKAALTKGYEKTFQDYQKGWFDYLKSIPQIDAKYRAQFNMAAMVLKAQEDKTVHGANVASLTIPWGGGVNANEDVGGGYHLVWSRDLYHVFTAYLALGDKAAAGRALDFLFKIQQKEDGSFPQNSWLDGKRGWGSLQMDEVGYPLIMAWQLGRFDKETYEKHVKRAADFLVKNGPSTPQERWEERPGYSPSTIAAEIAGLVCAADIAKKNGDEASAKRYLETADNWRANIEKWTATTTGKYGDGNYYLRITANGKPDAGEKIELNNGAGTFYEHEIVDAGFLELVRLGIKPANDPLIAKSVKVIDQLIKVDTPNGEGFYRYNHDGYGEMDDGRRWNWDGKYTGKGRLWALLSGERGQYELALSSYQNFTVDGCCTARQLAHQRLDAMLGFSNEGLMIPEQVWDKKEGPDADPQYVPPLKFGEGTGSATPLAWSMAQFIRLATNLKAGRNLDTPQIVYDRYVLRKTAVSTISNQKIIQLPEIPCSREYESIKTTFSADSTAASNRKTARFEVSKSPVFWGDKAIFFYKDRDAKVNFAVDSTGWKPSAEAFERVPNTDLQCAQLRFANTARVEYKLIVDGNWITDPLNPNKIDNGVGGENSFFAMPGYKPTAWDKHDPKLDVTFEKLDKIDIQSKILGELRRVSVFAVTLTESERYNQAVLYVQDGGDYVRRAKALEVWSNLIAAKKVKPFIMVFIDPKDRMKEYWANDKWADFVANEVVPEIDRRYHTIANRDGRATLGASLGGVTSIWMGLKHPETFSRLGGQSSSFWIDKERVIKELEKLDPTKTKFRFYLDAGTLEGVEDTRKAAGILRDKGYDVTYVEGESGHNWTAWRDRLADAFVALWK